MFITFQKTLPNILNMLYAIMLFLINITCYTLFMRYVSTYIVTWLPERDNVGLSCLHVFLLLRAISVVRDGTSTPAVYLPVSLVLIER